MIPDPNPSGKTAWQRVTSSHPCPICNKPDYCSISTDGRLGACRRVEVGAWKSKIDKAGTPVYLHRLDDSTTPFAPPPLRAGEAEPDRADAATLDLVYSALLATMPLPTAHREALRRRGLIDAEIDARGYGSLPIRGRASVAAHLRERFADVVLRVPGIVTRECEGRRRGQVGTVVATNTHLASRKMTRRHRKLVHCGPMTLIGTALNGFDFQRKGCAMNTANRQPIQIRGPYNAATDRSNSRSSQARLGSDSRREHAHYRRGLRWHHLLGPSQVDPTRPARCSGR